ncbi:MAG: hypothetical protein OXL98_06360 [Acidimicrobiaceae bacterium]|nr:hypothetical protein [Acidimicrobiaceae bacterium]
MDRYLTWNDALAKRFFHPDVEGAPVYYFVTEDVITEVGRTIGKSYEDFLLTVSVGPRGATWSGHCQRALQVADGWRDRGLEYPPYVAYLAVFVLAGGHEGDYAPQAYYPRLWSLLGEDRTGTLPSFDRMLELWDDLEQWSVHDRGGELGFFQARIVGAKIHVGLPLAQTILTETERGDLPRMFAAAKLDPGRVASTRELRRALVVHGRDYLRPLTMRALESRSEAFQEALLDAVAEDFSEWDGSVPATNRDHAEGGVFAGLRLCLEVDRIAGTARASLRVFTRGTYPENPINIAGLASEPLECVEYCDGWSTPLRAPASGFDHEPDGVAWRSGLAGADERLGWRVRLEPARVRVFEKGQTLMLPGLIEVLELPRDAPFYIAFDGIASGSVSEWLESDCEGWTPLQIASGLPAGWTLGTVDRASSDRGISDVRPGLGHADRLSMRLLGGVRASGRNTYFSFGPPRLAIHGASATHEVQVDGRVVEPRAGSTLIYELPADLPTDRRIGLEVLDGDDVVRRQSIYLMSGVSWRFEHPFVAVDSFGNQAEGGAICGAVAPVPDKVDYQRDLLRTPGLGGPEGLVYFVGRRRGEITVWPDEQLPQWQAVWAVPFRRRGRALFCGSSLADAEPLPERVGDRSHRRQWHDLLWRRRKRITPPSDRAQKSLWIRYRSIARDR